ncbi:uncharacterized protein AB9X84_015614 isoform 1-T2 [Acanthopagrus schlegelii]
MLDDNPQERSTGVVGVGGHAVPFCGDDPISAVCGSAGFSRGSENYPKFGSRTCPGSATHSAEKMGELVIARSDASSSRIATLDNLGARGVIFHSLRARCRRRSSHKFHV